MSWTYSPICDPDSSGPVLLRQRPAIDLPPAAVSRSVPHAACDRRGPSASRTAGCQWDLEDKSFFLPNLFKRKSICLSLLDIRCKKSWMPEALGRQDCWYLTEMKTQQSTFFLQHCWNQEMLQTWRNVKKIIKHKQRAESLTSERDYLVWLS